MTRKIRYHPFWTIKSVDSNATRGIGDCASERLKVSKPNTHQNHPYNMDAGKLLIPSRLLQIDSTIHCRNYFSFAEQSHMTAKYTDSRLSSHDHIPYVPYNHFWEPV